MGLLEPVNLIYAASIAALIVIYLRARSRPTMEVASLILFDEAPAPVAKSRMLRLDLPFWLEALALAALTLGIAGLYLKSMRPAGRFLHHALVFDLGAGMAADMDGHSRLDEARAEAERVVDAAPIGDEFSIITYGLEAQTVLPMTSRKTEARAALAAMRPLDIAPRPAALRAALIRARTADRVELYSDRPPPGGIISEAALPMPVKFKQVGTAMANLAIVALEPGMPKSTQGRCLVRSFAAHPRNCELAIDEDGRQIFHSSLIVEPDVEVMVPFGPLTAGGLVHARILTPDGLAADNERYALAPTIAPARALVLSPEPSVRDDLARLILAINPNFIVSAGDPHIPASFDHKRHYDLAVLHDSNGTGISAAARLYVFPEPRFAGVADDDPAQVVRSAALAEMEQTSAAGTLAAPVLLGPARIVSLPGWMTVVARGTAAGDHAQFPLAAMGRQANGAAGVITFDVRDHLLLDPDREDALVLTIDLLRNLIAPVNPQIAATADYAEVAVDATSARLFQPDGTVRTVTPNQWGQVRFRPLIAGRYRLVSGDTATQVFANYYDASESNLINLASRSPSVPEHRATLHATGPEVRPFVLPLAALALLALLAESLVLARRAGLWGMSRV